MPEKIMNPDHWPANTRPPMQARCTGLLRFLPQQGLGETCYLHAQIPAVELDVVLTPYWDGTSWRGEISIGGDIIGDAVPWGWETIWTATGMVLARLAEMENDDALGMAAGKVLLRTMYALSDDAPLQRLMNSPTAAEPPEAA